MAELYVVQTGPEESAGQTAMRTPRIGELFYLFEIVTLDTIKFLDGAPQAEVPYREDVGSLQGKDEKHFGGPRADTFDFYQFFFDFFVSQFFKLVKEEGAGGNCLSDVSDIVGFGVGETDGAELIGG